MPITHRSIGQNHFFCTSAPIGSNWLIYETRCKAKGIKGGFVYRAPSRHYAYKIAKVLNELYHLGRLGALARWKFVCSSSPCVPEHANMDFRFACDLLSLDDSKVICHPILSNGGQNG